jgi:hypothetical protein
MFNDDYSFRGKHANMVNDLTAPFDKNNNKLFARNLDVYLLAPIVGFLYQKKAEYDTKESTTNILYAAMSKETNQLWFIYRLILLLDKKHEPDFTTRVNKAFRDYGTQKAKPDEELFESYVRGGVEFLHEKLTSSVAKPEDYLKKLFELISEIENLYGQQTDEILNLVRLARD